LALEFRMRDLLLYMVCPFIGRRGGRGRQAGRQTSFSDQQICFINFFGLLFVFGYPPVGGTKDYSWVGVDRTPVDWTGP